MEGVHSDVDGGKGRIAVESLQVGIVQGANGIASDMLKYREEVKK